MLMIFQDWSPCPANDKNLDKLHLDNFESQLVIINVIINIWTGIHLFSIVRGSILKFFKNNQIIVTFLSFFFFFNSTIIFAHSLTPFLIKISNFVQLMEN